MSAVRFNPETVSEANDATCPTHGELCDERYRLSVEFEDGHRYDRCVACGRAHWVTTLGEIVPLPAS